MKTKGITVWEQHAEKFVLGLAGVLFVGFTAIQFIGEPNVVPLGAKKITPAEVDGILTEEAEELQLQMESSAPAPIDLPDPVLGTDDLLMALNGSISPRPTLALADANLLPEFRGRIDGGERTFYEPVVAAPNPIVATQTTDTLADGVVQAYEDLNALFPDENQPPDITFVTAFALFDRAELMARLRGEHLVEGDGLSKIPGAWFNDPIEILNVVIERQILVDGNWTELTTLDQIPGRFTLRQQLDEGIDGTARNQILATVSDPNVQTDITQPAFYATRNNEWLPAELDLDEGQFVGQDGEPEDPEVARITRRLDRERRREVQITRKLDELGGPLSGDGGVPGGPGGGRGGVGGDRDGNRGGGGNAPPGAPGGMGTGDSPGRRGDLEDQKNNKIRLRLTGDLHKVQARIRRLEQDLMVLIPDAVVDDDIQDEQDNGKIVVWGHDLFVEPGETYRYRVTLKLYNPFFAKKRSLTEEQEHLAESFTLSSDPSDWSEPITVEPRLQVYITSATAPGQRRGAIGGLGLGQVTAEVYKYFDGRQWMGTFKVQPGEHIGARQMKRPGDGQPPVEVDFSTGLYVLDIVVDIDASRSDARNSGLAATVLLQNARDAQKIEFRDPRTDGSDARRRDLRDKVKDRERLASLGERIP
ncbi:MAG: hypothetical protein IH878_14945 [Gemmatimonadetes bacterium]|nr:hypothetical protein [Gemmatimonadota bacterium]